MTSALYTLFTRDRYEVRPTRLQIASHTNPFSVHDLAKKQARASLTHFGYWGRTDTNELRLLRARIGTKFSS